MGQQQSCSNSILPWLLVSRIPPHHPLHPMQHEFPIPHPLNRKVASLLPLLLANIEPGSKKVVQVTNIVFPLLLAPPAAPPSRRRSCSGLSLGSQFSSNGGGARKALLRGMARTKQAQLRVRKATPAPQNAHSTCSPLRKSFHACPLREP